MKSPAKSRTLPSIAGKLREQGYATDFLYGGDINFTNMKSYLLGSGYQHLTADVDFSMEERKNPWGVNDDITFEYLYRQIKERNTNQPWHTAFLTLSSHEPFEVPYSRLANERLNAFAYTDSCIGDFVKQFRRLPQWKNTAVVLVPRPFGSYPERIGNLETGRYRIPLLIVGGAVRGRNVSVSTVPNRILPLRYWRSCRYRTVSLRSVKICSIRLLLILLSLPLPDGFRLF